MQGNSGEVELPASTFRIPKPYWVKLLETYTEFQLIRAADASSSFEEFQARLHNAEEPDLAKFEVMAAIVPFREYLFYLDNYRALLSSGSDNKSEIEDLKGKLDTLIREAVSGAKGS